MSMAKQDGGGDKLPQDIKNNYDVRYVIYHISNWILDFFLRITVCNLNQSYFLHSQYLQYYNNF